MFSNWNLPFSRNNQTVQQQNNANGQGQQPFFNWNLAQRQAQPNVVNGSPALQGWLGFQQLDKSKQLPNYPQQGRGTAQPQQYLNVGSNQLSNNLSDHLTGTSNIDGSETLTRGNNIGNTYSTNALNGGAGGGFFDGFGWDQGLDLANTLGGAILGFQGLNHAKDVFAHERDAWNKNFTNQVDSMNTMMSDRQAARYSANPNAYQRPDEYMAENRLQGGSK
ncbi:hypothetical protein [Enterovibrio norvegicus]|uniref:hypothetical protein n=1 Tax=Enterovibrio norvegicus TaxID=188144 RepID=UPI000C8432DC|nr:hypothetical protein [Enterovibrio norvegicus]PMN64309.1 hypothetical protein BCT27_10110 [Enterovibrio norvegicus]